jgi:uncharacterized membrane protein
MGEVFFHASITRRKKMLSNKELRAMARSQLKGKWTGPIVVALILAVIGILLSNIPYVKGGLTIILSGPLLLGFSHYFLNFKRGNNPKLEDLFFGFKHLGSSIALYLITGICILLWSLLLIIPGIVAGIRYSMSFYVLCDNPDIGALNALNKSKELMLENKMQLLLLWLSFLGWAVCCVFTFGIGFLWLTPYTALSMVNFYEELRAVPAGSLPAEGIVKG